MEKKEVKIQLSYRYKYIKASQHIDQLNEEIKKLKQEVGELKSYVAELEDTEKKAVRIQVKKEKDFDTYTKSIKLENRKLHEILRTKTTAITDLLCRVNKLEHLLESKNE